MSVNLKTTDIGSREVRLGSITGYQGDLKDLATQSRCGTLKGCGRCFSQSSTCLSGCSIPMLGQMRDVAVIHHSPSGCSSSASDETTKSEAERKGIINRSVYIGTDMNEKDTIFGAGKKLHDIILEVNRRYKPNAIFVGTGCAAGIIGEDIESIVEEVKDEIDVPVIALHCEGFQSRICATGFDIADQAVLRGLVEPPKQKRNTVIFKNFFESARGEITELFAKFDLEPIFLWTNATVEQVKHLSEAVCTTSICETLGNYLGNGLEELYGVPYIRTINPIGIEGYETWLRAIGDVAGKRDKVEAYIAEQRAIYLPQFEEVKKQLQGLTAVLGMGPGYAFQVARTLEELGIKTVATLAWHYDKQDEGGNVPPSMNYLLEHDINFEVTVTDQQNFEVMSLLRKYKPDIYLSRHPGTTVWATKEGIPAYFVGDEYELFGYKHTLAFAKGLVDTVTNRSFEQNMASHTKLPYTEWWYQQNTDRFMVKG